MISKYFTILTMLLMLILISACEEMPILLDEDRNIAPEATAGPYIILNNTETAGVVYLRSNIYSIFGIRNVIDKKKSTSRYGNSRKEHSADLTPIVDTTQPTQTFEVLLDDYKVDSIVLNHPQSNQNTVIGFLGGGRSRKELLHTAAKELKNQGANATVLTGGSFPLDENISSWDDEFFTPLQPLTPSSPLMFLPEDRRLMPKGIGRDETSLHYSYNIGSVHISIISLDSLKRPAEREQILNWLRADLELNNDKWRILVLSNPLFASQEIYARAIETLGITLENGGVDLVISGGADYYQRTLPIMAKDSKPIRYIVTGGISTGKSLPVGREYRAASANTPHIGVLTANADTLEWKILSLIDNSTADIVTVMRDGSSISGEPAIEKMDILTDALSALSLQREVITIATQAAKAVENPEKEQEISLQLENASTENIKGELYWEIPRNSTYTVSPPALKFGLDRGFQGKARFTITPREGSDNSALPVLKANIQGVGMSSQPLIVSKAKHASIKSIADNTEPVVIDGVMNEDIWTDATAITDFVVLGGEGEPKQPIESRLTYDERGIYILVRAAAESPAEIVTQAKARDDQIYKDESIEIFIDPKNNGRDYFQFAVNKDGVKLDRSSKLGLAWNPYWEAKVTPHSSYYTVEIFIPYQALGVNTGKKRGSTWALNICRNDYQNSAVRINPFASTANIEEVKGGNARVSRKNIGALAEEELGEITKPVTEKTTEKNGQAFEVSQWANTFGDNSRSGLYGKIKFD